MALINRIARMFRADFNAVLDRIEEPDVLLKQAVREMEESLYQDRQARAVKENEITATAERQREIQDDIKQVENHLDTCFESGKDDLARRQVRKKLELNQLLASLNKKLAALDKQKSLLEKKIEENNLRYLSMKQKLDVFINTSTEHKTGSAPELHAAITDDEVEVAFLQEQKARGAA